MTEKTFQIPLKYPSEDLLDFLRPKAKKKGWRMDGDAQSGSFSGGPLGLVSGAYEVRGNTVFVTIECSMDSLWGRIEKELYDFFG